MGSRSDLPVMQACLDQLKALEIPYEVRVLSAHRTPDAVLELSRTAAEKEFRSLLLLQAVPRI